MPRRLLLVLLPLLATPPALAQYVWKEPNGRMVFSDLPPPPGTPPAAIVRSAPSTAARKALPASESTLAPVVPADPSAPRSVEFRPASNGPGMPTLPVPGSGAVVPPVVQSGADKLLQQRRREAEQAAASARHTEDQARASQRKQDCATARTDLRTLEAGVPLLATGSDGSMEALSDAQRESRTQRLKTALAQCDK